MDSIAGVVAAKKLNTIKQTYTKGCDPDQNPESNEKLKEKIDKDLRKREEEKSKREEKYQERERQREKLRSRIREKYDIPDKNQDASTSSSKKSKKKKKELREKDFYKYNKAMPEEKGKKRPDGNIENPTNVGEKSDLFSRTTTELTDKSAKSQKDCIIS